jgi:hypothetical protein
VKEVVGSPVLLKDHYYVLDLRRELSKSNSCPKQKSYGHDSVSHFEISWGSKKFVEGEIGFVVLIVWSATPPDSEVAGVGSITCNEAMR